jgi:hypothetical protein
MIESAKASRPFRILLLLGAVILAACLFDKPAEEVQLSLTKVPGNVDRIRVVAVDPDDTSKVLDNVYAGSWQPGKTVKFSLGKATGKDFMLKVEGYQKDFLVYLSFVPSGKGGSDASVQVPVNRGLPAVFITQLARVKDVDSILFTSAFRAAPAGLHWHLGFGADSTGDRNYTPVYQSAVKVPSSAIDPGSILVADLHYESHERFPVQDPDTILADEALAPAGSTVRITDGYLENDSVHLRLAFTHFRVPDVDEAKPGQGFPKVLEKANFRILTDFRFVDGDPTHLVAPVWTLDRVQTVMVALYYANGMRIRPLASDSMAAATVLRTKESIPAVKVASYEIKGDTLTAVLTRTNFQGYHVHIYRDFMRWPNPEIYQTCYSGICAIGPAIWMGAKKLIFSAQQDLTHGLPAPIVSDTLLLP